MVSFQPSKGYIELGENYHTDDLPDRAVQYDSAKFHLSVSQKDLPKAWDLIAPLLVEKGIGCKVQDQKTVNSIDPPADAVNKRIVLYTLRKDLENPEAIASWKKLLTDIERRFKDHGIRSGGAIKPDRKIDGSDYIYMRWGKTIYKNGKAMDDSDQNLQIINNGVDPFADFTIHIPEITTMRDKVIDNGRGPNVTR